MTYIDFHKFIFFLHKRVDEPLHQSIIVNKRIHTLLKRKQSHQNSAVIYDGQFLSKTKVEISGIEPEASRMQSERSTTELYPRSMVASDKHMAIVTVAIEQNNVMAVYMLYKSTINIDTNTVQLFCYISV